MMLVLAFGRARDALLVMLNLPLALIAVSRGVPGRLRLERASMIGFITLFGIATRTALCGSPSSTDVGGGYRFP